MTTPAPIPPQPSPAAALGQTLLPSVLRTVVPLIYAMFVRWGVVSWLDPDDRLVTNTITVVVTALFYVAVRFAEQHWDKIGWVLGYARQPVYVQGQVLSVQDEPTRSVQNEPTTTTTVETDEDSTKT